MSLCGNLDFHRLYFLENRASRVAPTKWEIEKGCGKRFLSLATQTPMAIAIADAMPPTDAKGSTDGAAQPTADESIVVAEIQNGIVKTLAGGLRCRWCISRKTSSMP
jgi:hypothetical protein